jgi:SAM-dependent methyltransferase
MVRCVGCDLVYAVDPPSSEVLARAYHEAAYDSAEEAADASRSYLAALEPLLAMLSRREAVLEIGTGTGALLQHLQARGFSTLVGVEPSPAAIAAAPPQRRAWIRQGVFEPDAHTPGSFDLVCCFMTMEHVRDPLKLAREVRTLLRPGGAFVTVTHDYRSLVNRLLGRSSPIIDIEHMQLFSRRSVGELLSRAGYEGIQAASFRNCYTWRYWLRLAPLPATVKQRLLPALSKGPLREARLTLNVGNTLAFGFRPRTELS